MVTGAWALVTFEQESNEGEISYPLGKDARGSIYYLPDGHVSVHIMRSDRGITVDESLVFGQNLQYNQLGYLAYSGRFHVDEELQIMIHELDISLYPEWVGGQQIRKIELNGNRLQLSSNGPVGDNQIRFRLLWEKS